MTVVSGVFNGLLLKDELDVKTLAGSLMTINAMKLLRNILDNDGIKLTKSGALNRKCVEWAADAFSWPGYTPDALYVVNKVLNEDDFLPLYVMHELLRASRLIRKYKGSVLLSKAGKDIIGNYGALQAELFETFFLRFDFAGIERFASPFEYADYRHFLGVADNRLHDWTPVVEFSGWCLPIYANAHQGFGPSEGMVFFILNRVIRPLKWLGLLEEIQTGERYPTIDEIRIRKTALFNQFLRFVDIQPVTAFTQ